MQGGRIGGIGFSVGGEQLLEAAARNHRLRAVVADGAGERSLREVWLRGAAAALPRFDVTAVTSPGSHASYGMTRHRGEMCQVDEHEWLAERFEEHRSRLRAVAYRMLGSLSEADDAVQEAWLRLSRADAEAIANLGGWLTTVVARVSVDALRRRAARREEPLGVHLPEPIVDPVDGTDPEYEALLGDSVGLALLVVLDTLTPAERLAFVLHDMFAVPFDTIASMIDRTPEATRQLASRARRRVRGAAPPPDPDLETQWRVVDAFIAAARKGDFDALAAVLDPDVVLRADWGEAARGASVEVRGAAEVARRATIWARVDLTMHRALVNGAAGMVVLRDGEPFTVVGVAVRGGRVVEMDFLADPERLARLDLSILG